MARPGIQLLLLFLAVPAQYLISKWTTPTTGDREYMTRRLVVGVGNTIRKFISIEQWKSWLLDISKIITGPLNTRGITDTGECAAREVMQFREPRGFFAGSPTPRSPRPSHVKFRIGQVIKHKVYGYRGVIIGWDLKTKAPESWIQANHRDPTWRHQPNYSVLVDINDRNDIQTTYVVEENIEIVVNTEVDHPEVNEYFDGHDGAQYHPRPWLKELYPHD